MSETKLIGSVTVQLEKPNGTIIKSETKTNAITDPFLYNMLSSTTSLDPIAKILQGKDKSAIADPNRGQFYKQINGGSWGIYCMKTAVPVTKGTRLAPYCDGQNSISSDVAFYATDVTTTESNLELIAVPSRCGYSKVAGENKITVEYVKNTGTGTVKSVIFGRAHNDPLAMVGVCLGEFAQKSNFFGTLTDVLDHRTDRTLVWRYLGSSTAEIVDLLTKEIFTPTTNPDGPPSICNTSLTWAQMSAAIGTSAANGASGGLVINGHMYLVSYASNAADAVTCTLQRYIAASPAAADTKTFTFPVTAGTAYDTRFLPVMVTNPTNNTIEVYMPVSYGDFGEDGVGINVQKAVISNIANGVVADSVITLSDLGVWTNKPVPCGNNAYSSLGYFDQITNKYYFPSVVKCNSSGSIIQIGTQGTGAGVIPGYVYDNTWSIVGEWIARASIPSPYVFNDNNLSSISPVRTDQGLEYYGYNTTQNSYPTIGQVLSGVVLTDEYVKESDNILRIIYSYQLS